MTRIPGPKVTVSNEHVELLLKLYDLRREARLRQARQWFTGKFQAASPEEVAQKYPPGTDEDAYLRMVLSYWDMVAVIVNRGALDEEFFLETTGEHFLVWEKIKHLVPAIRAGFNNPMFLQNLEALAQRTEAWREQHAPGSTEAFRQYMQRRAQAQAAR